ncbi:MAG: ABC transporter ATP-binding protein/permease [Acidimicrobiales bacterium]
MSRSPLRWLGGLIVVYLAVPMLAFGTRLGESSGRGFHQPGLLGALSISVVASSISLALITAFGVPLAFYLARSESRTASVVGIVVQLPLAIPPLMSGILLVYLVGPYTLLGKLFGGHLTESLTGVVLAQTFVAAPFLIVSARAAFGTVDPALLDVAATLGHGETSRFWRVALPLAAPGIRTGMLLAWLRAFGEYGATVVLAYNPSSLPVFTYIQFSGRGLPDTLAPTTLALAVAGIGVAVSRHRWRERRRRPVVLPAAGVPPHTTPAPVRFDVDYRVGAFHLALSHGTGGNHLAIVGPSGSGKSTVLRVLAGLLGDRPGRVWYGDRQVDEVRVEDRRVGYVAQGFSLYPHLTVWQHLLFADEATPESAAYWLAHLRLHGLQDRFPVQLSGGQRQRVGLAQALCRSPDLLLLDEPFSSLDAPVRRELQRELRRLQRETGLTTILVTHDPEEAALLADEVIVISEGTVLQTGTVREVFARPASPDVARLLGIPNLGTAVVSEPGWIDAGGIRIAVDSEGLVAGTSVLWSIRPERVALVSAETRVGGITGRLVDVAEMGTSVELLVALTSGLELRARRPDPVDLEIGRPCHIELPADAITLWPASSGPSALGYRAVGTHET